jgi:Cellulose binding domain
VVTSLGRSRIRSMVVTLAVAAFAAVGAVMVVPKTDTAFAQASSVEDEGANCPVAPGSTINNPLLPDPFLRLDGTRISTKDQWRCRRAEIRELSEQFVYGQKPVPTSVTGTVSNTSVAVNVSANGRSASFSAGVQLPSGSGPFPAVIVYGGFGADTGTILASGAAVINYNPIAVGAEGTPRSNKQGAFYTLYGNNSSTGLLMAWAWGASRIIDVIQQSGGNILRPSVGVTGCSRYGKGAFVAGAFDQRIALTMPIESGSAGAPIFRGIPGEGGAQPLSSAYGEQPWLGDAFGSFTGSPNGLPVDTHEVVGMIAPRGLFIMENPHIDWLAARSGSVAALGGREIYTALGAQANISYSSNVQSGTHCASRGEWQGPLQQSINRFLRGTGSAPGVFSISPNKAGNLGQWRNWQTPILADGPNTGPPSSPPTSPPTTPPSSPPTGTGCTATVGINQWQGGFVATVRVGAGAAPVDGWTVRLNLPPGATITNGWNADRSGNTGTVDFTNVGWNRLIPAGQFVEFGFQSSGTGAGMTPTCSTG